MDLTLWIELVLFIVLMLLSGFFSSSETSLFSLNKLQFEQMRRDENPRIGLIERLLSEPRRLIVTILIGNEFVNVAASVISAAIVIRLLGAENKFINLFVMVPILLLVGEITPKTLAIRNNVAFATFQSVPLDLFARLIMPLRWIIREISEGFTTLLIGKEHTRGSIVTEDMVRTLAHEAVGEGVLDHTEAQYIDHIFEFGNRTLGDIMTPRSNVLYLQRQQPLTEMVATIRQTRHTKIPVYGDNKDEIVGILYARDLLAIDPQALTGTGEQVLAGLLRQPYFVPETKLASELFKNFRRDKLSLALTVDEYGGVTGLVSMEDLLECIFGDIRSPSEQLAQVQVERLADGGYRIDGAMTLDHFNREFGTELLDDEVETIGGLVLHSLGELPARDTSLELGGLYLTVTSVANNRVLTLTVVKPPRDHSEAALADPELPAEDG